MKKYSTIGLMVVVGWTVVAPALKALPAHAQSSENRRFLIIEAEDMGMAHSIDQASFKAMERHWVTSSGVLVLGPWLPEVAQWARHHSDADIGIRLDLTSEWSTCRWRPVSQARSLYDGAGYFWDNPDEVIRHASMDDVALETRAQIQFASRTGIRFSHLDQRIMLVAPSLFHIYVDRGEDAKIPISLSRAFVQSYCTRTPDPNIRNCSGSEIDMRQLLIDQELQIRPGFSKETWLAAYENALRALPPGTYLLRVHLGFNDEELRAMTWDHPNWGAEWRQNDYDVISSPEFHKFLKDQGFILVSWKDLEKRASEAR